MKDKGYLNIRIQKEVVWLLFLLLIFFLVNLPVFSLLKNLVIFFDKYSGGLTVILTLVIAIFGGTWIDVSKKKMKGKLDYDIARKYLKAIFEIRDMIRLIRSPFVSDFETKKALDENPSFFIVNKEQEAIRAVYTSRIIKLQKVWTNLEEILTDAEVSWGVSAIEIQSGLDSKIRKLRSIFWLYANYPNDINETDRKILYSTDDSNDIFSKEINDEIEKIRKFLGSHL